MITKATNVSEGLEPFQQRVDAWLIACFGEEIARDRIERNHRFLEEALELVQAAGCTASEAHQLVDYTFARPVGEIGQEVGGVMNTLAALCLAHDLDMAAEGDREMARVWTKVDAIREKQRNKPKHSPLPQHVATLSPPLPSPEVERLRELLTKASPGPWTADDGAGQFYGVFIEETGAPLAYLAEPSFNEHGQVAKWTPLPEGRGYVTEHVWEAHRATAELIALAVNFVRDNIDRLSPPASSRELEQRARKILADEYMRTDHARNFNRAGLYSSILHKRLERLARRDQIAIRAIMSALSTSLPSPLVVERQCSVCTAVVSSYPEGMCCHCQEMPWPVRALSAIPLLEDRHE